MLEWLEADPLPPVCQQCEENYKIYAAATDQEKEELEAQGFYFDCGSCEHGGERFYLSRADELRLAIKRKATKGDREARRRASQSGVIISTRIILSFRDWIDHLKAEQGVRIYFCPNTRPPIPRQDGRKKQKNLGQKVIIYTPQFSKYIGKVIYTLGVSRRMDSRPAAGLLFCRNKWSFPRIQRRINNDR